MFFLFGYHNPGTVEQLKYKRVDDHLQQQRYGLNKHGKDMPIAKGSEHTGINANPDS